jgi:hypothetical protein
MDESEKLWKYTVQLRKIAEHREADAEDEIRSEYLGVLEKLQAIIAKYYAKYGDSETGVMTHGDLRAVGQYKVFLQDVIDNLDGVSKPVDKAIRQAIEDTYTTCYNGFSDAVKLSESDNKPLSTLLSGLQSTTPETVKNIVENPMDKLTLSKILNRRRSKIVSETKKTLAVGLANGDSYTRMAQRISDTLNGDFKKAMRIVRTESNRAINRGFQDVSEDAAELLLGSDYVEVKEWCSMEDELVRSTHSHLNGKIIHVLDSFESGGAKAKCPGTFGVAAEDINCRCFLDYSFMDRDEFIAQGGVIPDEVLGKEVDISGESGIIKEDNSVIKDDVLPIVSAMPNIQDGSDFLNLLNNCQNENIKRAYKKCSFEIGKVEYTPSKGAYYQPSGRTLTFNYPTSEAQSDGKSKYSTLSHEYGHFIDDVGNFKTATYIEVDKLNGSIGLTTSFFKHVPSSSDSFLTALRKDKQELKKIIKDADEMSMLCNSTASAGVQDAISGMFSGTWGKTVKWGHDEDYYNRKYNILKRCKLEKNIKAAYQEIGLDASNQTKVKSLVRNYETASEMWANIMSAETCGGLELEYVKKYMPNSYKAFVKLLEGME